MLLRPLLLLLLLRANRRSGPARLRGGLDSELWKAGEASNTRSHGCLVSCKHLRAQIWQRRPGCWWTCELARDSGHSEHVQAPHLLCLRLLLCKEQRRGIWRKARVKRSRIGSSRALLHSLGALQSLNVLK